MNPSLACICAVAVLLVPVRGTAQATKATPPPAKAAPAGDKASNEDTLYAIGVMVSRNLKQLGLTPGELETVKRGLTDALTGQKLKADPEAFEKKIQAFAEERSAAAAKVNREAGKAFVAKAAAEKGAKKSASGLVFTSVKEGTGATPKPQQRAKMNFRGSLVDGTVFEDSSKRGPIELPLSQTFPCLSEGVQKMKVGGKARLVCPPEIAFGDAGRPPLIGGGATLVLDVELLGVSDAPQMPAGHGGGMPPGHGGGMPPGHGSSAPTKK